MKVAPAMIRPDAPPHLVEAGADRRVWAVEAALRVARSGEELLATARGILELFDREPPDAAVPPAVEPPVQTPVATPPSTTSPPATTPTQSAPQPTKPRSKPKTDRTTTPSKKQDARRGYVSRRVLAIVRAAGADGIQPREVAKALGHSDHRTDLWRVSQPLARLRKAGLVRATGSTSNRRYTAVGDKAGATSPRADDIDRAPRGADIDRTPQQSASPANHPPAAASGQSSRDMVAQAIAAGTVTVTRCPTVAVEPTTAALPAGDRAAIRAHEQAKADAHSAWARRDGGGRRTA